MRSSLPVLVGALGLLGCVSLPHAKLLQHAGAREEVTGPVVCGPLGFRKVPLQSRWGEYVRLTVSAQAALHGSVLVHAGGVTLEPRTWSTESTGALVVEARFPNEDVDSRFALHRERPIDITLTGLEGACEGAVFTVEHGALVPSVDERAWIAELERRGGPELAARRELARLAAEGRRQAHYAQWEARQVEVSAEVVAQAELVRETHYAQWEARRGGVLVVAQPDEMAAGVGAGGGISAVGVGSVGSGVGSPSSEVSIGSGCTSGSCAGSVIAVQSGDRAGSSVAVHSSDGRTCASGDCAGSSVTAHSSDSRNCASGVCAGSSVTVRSSGSPSRASGDCAGSSVTVHSSDGRNCASGDRAGASVTAHSIDSRNCTSGSCAAPSVIVQPSESGSCNSASCQLSAVAVGPETGDCASGGCFGLLQPAAPVAQITSPGEWSQPSDARLRASAELTWAQPSDAQLQATASVEASWTQPFAPQLEERMVTRESQVATSSAPRFEATMVTTDSQVAASSGPCGSGCAQSADRAASVLVPALFQMMFNVGAAAAHPVHPAHHSAEPISRPR